MSKISRIALKIAAGGVLVATYMLIVGIETIVTPEFVLGVGAALFAWLIAQSEEQFNCVLCAKGIRDHALLIVSKGDTHLFTAPVCRHCAETKLTILEGEQEMLWEVIM